MTKNDYRLFFAECKKFLKLSYFAGICDIPVSNITMFLKGYDGALSLDRCLILYRSIFDQLENLA